MSPFRLRLQPIDGALILLALIWGGNFTVVKIAVRHIPELPFNSLRLIVASAAFIVTIAAREGLPRLTRGEWTRVLLLGVVGHLVYQLCFLGAVARTTVANSALTFAFTPVAVALLTAALGHERIPPTRWAGAAVSVFGIYLVVGGSIGAPGATRVGDLLAVGAMLCWAVFTVGARPMLATRSPLLVTGYSMTIGSLLYVPLAWSGFRSMDWRAVPSHAWAAVVLSALLALYICYVIWYTAVQKIGSTRTSAYSNVTPLAAMAVAAIFLGEPVGLQKLTGAAAVLLGVALTRLERQPIPPAET